MKVWTPMRRLPDSETNPDLVNAYRQTGDAGPEDQIEMWVNDVYQATVVHHANGLSHISLKRHDRYALRDWRHLQQIKNETCGPEREGMEIFPRESRLVDGANQFHLWVLPEDMDIPLGYNDGPLVMDEEEARSHTEGLIGQSANKGRQRPWQPGLTTGKGDGGGTSDD